MTTIGWAVATAVWAASFMPVETLTDLPVGAAEPTPVADLVLAPESRLWVEGTSTARGYSCEAKEMAVKIRVDPSAGGVEIANLGQVVQGVSLDIGIEELDCGNGTMNDHMRKALQSKDHPTISFKVNTHKVTLDEDGNGKIEMVGDLTIAGSTKPIELNALAAPGEAGAIRITGVYDLNMTEWGVKPPRLMFGAMKVNENVKVNFDLALKEQ